MRTDTAMRTDTPYPRGESVITHELGRNLAKQLACVDYIECTVKEEYDGPRSVNGLFTKVVNKTRKSGFQKGKGSGTSKVCVIL